MCKLTSSQATDLVDTIHDLDKRVAVVETRQVAQENELVHIRDSINGIRNAVLENTALLREHITEENADRKKLLVYAITTLVTVLLSGGGVVLAFLLAQAAS